VPTGRNAMSETSARQSKLEHQKPDPLRCNTRMASKLSFPLVSGARDGEAPPIETLVPNCLEPPVWLSLGVVHQVHKGRTRFDLWNVEFDLLFLPLALERRRRLSCC